VVHISDRLLFKPVEHELVSLWRLKLGGHVTCSSNCAESQAAIFVNFYHSRNLGVVVVRSPCF
jgi:hypothetical protein